MPANITLSVKPLNAKLVVRPATVRLQLGALVNAGGGGGGGGGVTDHGALTGLTPDDDHPQYFNTTRGDVRYPLKATVATYIHTQGSPQLQWVILHNLNREGVSVTVRDNNGREVLCEPREIDQTAILIDFLVAQTGKAYVQ